MQVNDRGHAPYAPCSLDDLAELRHPLLGARPCAYAPGAARASAHGGLSGQSPGPARGRGRLARGISSRSETTTGMSSSNSAPSTRVRWEQLPIDIGAFGTEQELIDTLARCHGTGRGQRRRAFGDRASNASGAGRDAPLPASTGYVYRSGRGHQSKRSRGERRSFGWRGWRIGRDRRLIERRAGKAPIFSPRCCARGIEPRINRPGSSACGTASSISMNTTHCAVV